MINEKTISIDESGVYKVIVKSSTGITCFMKFKEEPTDEMIEVELIKQEDYFSQNI